MVHELKLLGLQWLEFDLDSKTISKLFLKDRGVLAFIADLRESVVENLAFMQRNAGGY